MNNSFRVLPWAQQTNIYEVNLRQYSEEGTINAFARHLPRLQEMGVRTIWLMPVHPIGQLNRKGSLGSYYACSDYTAINPEFGTLADFRKLVAKAHKLEINVMLDWVANHTGWDHVWTQSHPDFFTKDEAGQFKPPFPDWEDVIHLDYGNRGLRETMIEAMKFWVREADIDGYRCDMAHLVPLDFWVEARMAVDAVKPLFWLAETEEISYHQAFDATYSWELLHTLEKYWKKETDLNAIDGVLFKYANAFPSRALRLFFTSNHDENSHSGTEYERMGESAIPFAVLTATWNAIPLIYSGQELPMKDKRLAFFDKDCIPWDGEYRLAAFYRSLLSLRSRHPALAAGDPAIVTLRLDTDHNKQVFAFLRKIDDREVLVILNLADSPVQVRINGLILEGTYTDAFSAATVDLSGSGSFELGPWGYRVLEK